MSLVLDEAHSERQLQAILFTLVTLGYIDGSFDPEERKFIEEKIQEMVDVWISESDFYQNLDPGFVESVKQYEKQNLLEVLDSIDQSLSKLMETEVGIDDELNDFISSRLILRCFEVLSELTEPQRAALLDLVDRLIEVDGTVHPAEVRFKEALVAELARKPPQPPTAQERPFDFSVRREPVGCPNHFEHPLLAEVETPFPLAPEDLRVAAEADVALMQRAIETLAEVRRDGWGRLEGIASLSEMPPQEPFVDCLAYCYPASTSRATDYIVVGDLHGCFGSLKAVLAQTDFFGRVARFRASPETEPDIKIIFLGDYLDRGFWAWEGVVRTVLRLFVEYPQHVIPLVGNHEWLIERDGRIVSSVIPADAVDRWESSLPHSYFSTAKTLFDQLSSVVLIDRIMLVHGGIPRHRVVSQWQGLKNLNDPEVRLEMCWSDPVMVPEVPPMLQEKTQRFAFGISQFTAFMDAVGARVMIRSHEKVGPGFRTEYDDGRFKLFTVFSAGGYNNRDLPEQIDYRLAHPAFVWIQERNGKFVANPVRIAWEKFNDKVTNRYLTVFKD